MALVSGFFDSLCFRESIHVICMIHFKDNVERKLTSLGVGTKNQKEIVMDILGHEENHHGTKTRCMGFDFGRISIR